MNKITVFRKKLKIKTATTGPPVITVNLTSMAIDVAWSMFTYGFNLFMGVEGIPIDSKYLYIDYLTTSSSTKGILYSSLTPEFSKGSYYMLARDPTGSNPDRLSMPFTLSPTITVNLTSMAIDVAWSMFTYGFNLFMGVENIPIDSKYLYINYQPTGSSTTNILYSSLTPEFSNGTYYMLARDTAGSNPDLLSIPFTLSFAPTITVNLSSMEIDVSWSMLSYNFNLFMGVEGIPIDSKYLYINYQPTGSSTTSILYSSLTPEFSNGTYYMLARDTAGINPDILSMPFTLSFAPTITVNLTSMAIDVSWSMLSYNFNLFMGVDGIPIDSKYLYINYQPTGSSTTSILYSSLTPEFSNGTYYMLARDTAGINPDLVSIPFTLSNAPVDIAAQWQTVYDDSINLMTKGLLDGPYRYLLKTQPESFIQNANLPNNLDANNINTLYFSGENMLLSSTGEPADIGVNNNIYKIQLPQTNMFAFTIESPYITMGGPNIFVPTTKTVSLTESDFSDINTLYIVNDSGDLYSQFVYKAPISSITMAKDVVGVVITYTQWTPVYGKISNPWPSQKNVFVDGVLLVSDGAYNSTDGTTSVIIQTNDTNIINGSTIVISSSLTPTIQYIQNDNYYYSYTTTDPVTLTLSINAPTNSTTNLITSMYYTTLNYDSFTYKYSLGPLPGTQISTPFIPSTGSAYVNSFTPPEWPLSSLSTVNDIKSLTSYSNYLPTILPGNDYTLLPGTNDYSLYWSSPSSSVMDSDQCRQPWRLSNYIRSYDEKNQDIIKIALNTANAMYYNGTLPDPDNPNYEVSLGINTYDFTSGHGGYSGDMVPPLIALIDALVLQGIIDPTNEINNLVYFIKNLNNTAIEGESTLSRMISNLEGKTPDVSNQKVYPILDSRISGGQQLGLAGVGLICTLDFLTRDGYNVMDKYGAITDWGVYDNSKLFINKSSANAYQQFNDERFNAIIQIYLMQCMRGNGFSPYEEWGNDAGAENYAKQILNKAYMTNVRIRGINISKANELAFGPNDQQNEHTIRDNSGPSGTYSYYAASPGTFNPQTGNVYVPTYFPIYGIPDQGWGSLTVEIFSYIGVALVGMNDYTNFCRWHRMYYFLLFQQNGGDMVGWSDSSTDKIIQKDSTPSVMNKDANGVNFWIPEYLTDDKISDITGDSDNWANDVLNSNPAVHYFDIYKWPLENVVTNGSSSTSDNPTTKYWANRFNPYRGSRGGYNGNEFANNKVQWSTPSYCMGYSPVWVAGGKTMTTNGWDDTKVNRPVAEALNPHFSNVLGLYSATDGDNNAFIAYTLASLQWPDTPTITDLNFNSTNKGYNCDVCDFNVSAGKDTEPGGFGEGVLAAVNELHPSGFHGYKNELINLTNCVGYGFKPPNDGQNAVGNWTPITDKSGERATTWAYIAKSIQRTMISTHGNGFSGNFGNFSPNGYAPTATAPSSRIVTLGHDSSAGEGPIKMDYQDLRIYQICKQMNNL